MSGVEHKLGQWVHFVPIEELAKPFWPAVEAKLKVAAKDEISTLGKIVDGSFQWDVQRPAPDAEPEVAKLAVCRAIAHVIPKEEDGRP